MAAGTPSTSAEPDFLADLNQQQRRAVLHDGGPLAVLAGPGSGKTRVIVHRVARLLGPVDRGGAGVEPSSVVALAFTVKAAEEMRGRLHDLVGFRLANSAAVETSHAFGARLVHRFGDMIGLPPATALMDSAQRRRLLRALLREHDLFADRAGEGRETVISHASQFIHQCATDAVTPAALSDWCAQERRRLESGDHDLDDEALEAAQARQAELAEMARLYAAFEDARLAQGLLTFDDYITLPLRILRERSDAAAIVRDDFRHFVVDEFQDWTPAQIELLSLLAPPRSAGGPDLCVVGDDDQSIFAFRGADDKAFKRFADRWPDHEEITLTINYRSAPVIIQTANAIIQRAEERFAPDKVIEPNPQRKETTPASLEGVNVDDDYSYGVAIAAMILADRDDRGGLWSEYGVVVRNNLDRERIVAALEAEGIPVATPVSPAPLDDQAVQDLLAWVGLLADPADDFSARRLLIQPPFFADVAAVGAWAQAHRRAASEGDERPFLGWLADRAADDAAVASFLKMAAHLRQRAAVLPADETLRDIVRVANLAHRDVISARERADRIRNLVEVLRFARAVQPHLDPPGDVRAWVAYYHDLDAAEQAFDRPDENRLDGAADDERPDAVQVLTAHKAKGLEFDTVFVARVNPGHGFPGSRSASDEEALPPALTGREPANPMDEERRLFYVACTRAERRLVLLAKTKKRRGNSVDFFYELKDDAPDLPFDVAHADRWLEQAGLRPPSDLEAEADVAAHRRARLRRVIDEARRDASIALHEASRPGVSVERIDDLTRRLTEASHRMAAAAHLIENQEAPPGLVESHPLADALRLARRRLETIDQGSRLFKPMRPPLRLSFTSVNDYLKCPRCFFVKYVLGYDEGRTAALSVGSIIHAALERFFNEFRAADAEGRPTPGVDRLLALGSELHRSMWPRSEPLDPDVEAQALAQLRTAWETLHDPEAQILEIEQMIKAPVVIDGAEHNLIAKIDRLDLLPEGGYRLVDYKTGQAWKSITEPRTDDLQLCIYAMALHHQLDVPDDEPLEGVAEYWALSEGVRGVIALSDLDVGKVRGKIADAARGMLAGEYPRGKERECRGLCEVLGDA